MLKNIIIVALILFSIHSAYAQNNSNADLNSAITFYKNQQYAQALPILLKLSTRGNKNCYKYLAQIYYWGGDGVKKDCNACISWLNKGVSANDEECQLLAAGLYEKGACDVSKNEAEAAKYYLAAAQNGNASAMYHLASLFENGSGVQKNLSEAKTWYKKAVQSTDYIARTQSRDRLEAIQKTENTVRQGAPLVADDLKRLNIPLSATRLVSTARHGDIRIVSNDPYNVFLTVKTEGGKEIRYPLTVKLAVTTEFYTTPARTSTSDYIQYDYFGMAGTDVTFFCNDYRKSPSSDPETINMFASNNFSIGSVASLTLAKQSDVLFWGAASPIRLPAGTVVDFYFFKTEIVNGRYAFAHRASTALLGADADIPGLGRLKKGTTFEFAGLYKASHMNPDVGGFKVR